MVPKCTLLVAPNCGTKEGGTEQKSIVSFGTIFHS